MLSIAHRFPFLLQARHSLNFPAASFSDFFLARTLADTLNSTRDLQNQPALTVKAGDLAGAAILDEVFATVIAQYLEEVAPAALDDAASFLDENLGALPTQTVLQSLRDQFDAPMKRPDALEMALRLRLANLNPASRNFSEIFDDSGLPVPHYEHSIGVLDAFFQTMPPFGEPQLPLWQLLLSPILAHPDSIGAQLRFVLARFGPKITRVFGTRILESLDLIAEENKPVFFGSGPAQVLEFKSGAASVGMEEWEAFSPDREWMPRTVLLAKQTYVWLDQLSKKFGREITRLDQVPDEELDEIAARGMTGLWLIGVWQRSGASQKIKRATGNPDAIASAYSLFSYEIAGELGGAHALDNLKGRAAARGIRMASDMVPNHMAIDSRWVIEHPDWFLGLPFAPFPYADFNTPDLCDDPRIGVFLEAGYYSKTDASVVFKRVEYGTEDVRFLYHGNDGTNMPWNDTAQLNYLSANVREAVLQTILGVARQFPIIRFDAAMTLAKRHIHRLWFPAPGSGGDIPSRAGRGLSPQEFENAMPVEFWREVVDAVAREAPDTLLLAEAFWMMEGYFVRTLGMHRVYNSAFMNMLRDEDNAQYRQTLKNTLEFDREILGRFVNFLNNPDEKTASEQFGKGDKYFGVCTLLSTLPGLPMFGHGQIEGYGEKYGMEYPRAYWNEVPDAPFIAHHERVIFPLLRKRALFAGAENFTLYDLWHEGAVNENVFAYSNQCENERAVVVFNNSGHPTCGWIHQSCAFAVKHSDGSRPLERTTLSAALGLSREENRWTIFREHNSGLEFLRSSKELTEKGLWVQLGAYGTQVFWEWREATDDAGLYARLAQKLGGAGVASVELALRELLLEPILTPFTLLCDPLTWSEAFSGNTISLRARARVFAATLGHFLKVEIDADAWSDQVEQVARSGEQKNGIEGEKTALVAEKSDTDAKNRGVDSQNLLSDRPLWPDDPQKDGAEKAVLLAYGILKLTGEASGALDGREKARLWLEEWLLKSPLRATLESFGAPESALLEIRLWLSFAGHDERDAFTLLSRLLADPLVQEFLGINNFERTIWFRGEKVGELLEILETGAALEGVDLPLAKLEKAANNAQYRVVKWMESAREIPN